MNRLILFINILVIAIIACGSQTNNETLTPLVSISTNTIKPTNTSLPSPTMTPTIVEPTASLTATFTITATKEITLTSTITPTSQLTSNVVIINVNKVAEYVDLKNNGNVPQDLKGWVLVSERGNQRCILSGIIQPEEILRIWANNPSGSGFNCGFGTNIWNNSEKDTAILYDSQGKEVSRY